MRRFDEFKTGLKGILRSRSLWATSATASKDDSEVKYALGRARNLVALLPDTIDPSFFPEIIEQSDPVGSELVDTLGWKVYLVSFRTNTNGSGHWETYGDCAKGAALSFGMKPLAVGLLLLPVIYDEVSQDKAIREFLDCAVSVTKQLSQSWSIEEYGSLRKLTIRLAALGLWTLAPLMKAPSFSDEQEWRLIAIVPEQADARLSENLSKEAFHRQVGSREVPYKVLTYEWLPLMGIGLGRFAPIECDDPELRELASGAKPVNEVRISRSRVAVVKT